MANKCIVSGYVYDSAGVPVSGVAVSAILNTDDAVYVDGTQIARSLEETETDDDGLWALALVETDNIDASGGVGYLFTFRGEEIYSKGTKQIPNLVSANYSELDDVV